MSDDGPLVRLFCAAAMASLAAAPIVAAAASPSPTPSISPSLSPSLSQILVAAPSGFAKINDPPFTGRFDAKGYTDSYGTKAAEADRILTGDGFVDGYGIAWSQPSARHALIEYVIAFKGGSGAKKWLQYEEAADHNNPGYLHSDSITGIDTYYGVHLQSSGAFLDGFSFVKGNDMIGVGFLSAADDVLSLTVAQTRKQYAAAPASTIPPSQWPENAPAAPAPATSSSGVGIVLPLGLIALVVVAVVGVVGGLVVMLRRRAPVAPAAPMAAVAPFGQAAPAVQAPAAPEWVAPQLSPDRNYWWDGQAWKDSSVEAPPGAQRSPDGNYWWDGASWRPAPQPAARA